MHIFTFVYQTKKHRKKVYYGPEKYQNNQLMTRKLRVRLFSTFIAKQIVNLFYVNSKVKLFFLKVSFGWIPS